MTKENTTPQTQATPAPAPPVGNQNQDEMLKSINELRTEVKELRELVNMLLEIVVSMEQDEQGDFEPSVYPQDKFSPYSHFSM